MKIARLNVNGINTCLPVLLHGVTSEKLVVICLQKHQAGAAIAVLAAVPPPAFTARDAVVSDARAPAHPHA